MADFGLAAAAKPVLKREADMARKRATRAAAKAAKVKAASLAIVCESGFVIRPIKGGCK